MDGFVATFVNRLDQKGRVSVPAPFRSVLAREGQDGVYIYPALDRPAIDGGGARLQEAIAERLQHLRDLLGGPREPLDRLLWREPHPEDRSGRPGRAAGGIPRYAGIADTAVFVGQGFKFQIWEPQRFAERRSARRARIFAP